MRMRGPWFYKNVTRKTSAHGLWLLISQSHLPILDGGQQANNKGNSLSEGCCWESENPSEHFLGFIRDYWSHEWPGCLISGYD